MTQFNINQKFEFLGNLASMVMRGTTPSLIVVGEGGLGKTHSINQSLQRNALEGDDYMVFKGYSTARGLYNALYDNNGKIIIFDDCDSILEDKVALNILKSALDSYERRTISWMAKMNKSDEYPQQFDFTGGIIFISNKSRESIDGAILSRSLVVDLTMTFDEKISRMQHILPNIMSDYTLEVKQDALNFLKTQKEGNINFRTLIMVSKVRVSFPEGWKDMATYMMMN
jgi:hypothetical protein